MVARGRLQIKWYYVTGPCLSQTCQACRPVDNYTAPPPSLYCADVHVDNAGCAGPSESMQPQRTCHRVKPQAWWTRSSGGCRTWTTSFSTPRKLASSLTSTRLRPSSQTPLEPSTSAYLVDLALELSTPPLAAAVPVSMMRAAKSVRCGQRLHVPLVLSTSALRGACRGVVAARGQVLTCRRE